MGGTKAGGIKTAKTNKDRYGLDYYQQMGAEGGKAEHPNGRGFELNRELASKAGSKGGKLSRRGRAVK